MNFLYQIVGMVFVVGVGLVLISLGVGLICNAIRRARENRYELWAKNVCSQIDRWCDYEFPQVGYTMRELSKCISSGWSYSPETFRENLRNGYWKHKDQKPKENP